MVGVANGLPELHLKNIIYADIKTENILIFGKSELFARISDFGMSVEGKNAYFIDHA